MAGSFSVGALALAAERANAVGAVRLTLAPERLEIELLRVGSFQSSFIPGALVEMVRFSVPYLAIRGLVRRGPLVCLALDPTVACPFNRFTLSRFTDAPLDALVGAHRARVRARLATWALPMPLGVLAALLVPSGLAAGALGRLAIAVVCGLVAYVAMRELAAWTAFGGPISRYFRDAFEVRLSERLGIAPQEDLDEPFEPPALVVAPAPLSRPPPSSGRSAILARGAAPASPSRSDAPPASRRVAAPVAPRPVPARPAPAFQLTPRRAPRWIAPLAAASFAVLGTLGIMAFLKRYGGAESPIQALLPTAPEAARGVGDAALAMTTSEIAVPSKYARCACNRADSPLWREGLPELSVLVSSGLDDETGRPRGDIAPQPDEKGVYRYDFDLSVVNNSNRDLHDIRTVLTFARRNARDERIGATDRGLFWEGALRPGRAVKWHVEAPGTEVRIDTDIHRTLAEGEAGPADRFFRLTSAHQRVVRLHGALMLAYIGDPRAEAAARGLGTLSESEEKIREQILRAVRPLKVCDPVLDAEDPSEARAVSVCVFNATTRERRGVVVRPVAESGGSPPAWPAPVPVDDVLPVHEGFRIDVAFGAGAPPGELEATDGD